MPKLPLFPPMSLDLERSGAAQTAPKPSTRSGCLGDLVADADLRGQAVTSRGDVNPDAFFDLAGGDTPSTTPRTRRTPAR